MGDEKMMRKKRKFIVTIMLVMLIFSSCNIRESEVTKVEDKTEYHRTNINIFKDSSAWELALAVKNQKTKTIEKIAKKILNY